MLSHSSHRFVEQILSNKFHFFLTNQFARMNGFAQIPFCAGSHNCDGSRYKPRRRKKKPGLGRGSQMVGYFIDGGIRHYF